MRIETRSGRTLVFGGLISYSSFRTLCDRFPKAKICVLGGEHWMVTFTKVRKGVSYK